MAAAAHEPLLDDLVELSRLMVGLAYRSLHGLHRDLDLPSFRALAFVDRHPDCTMGQLARGIALPSSSTTRLCDKLVDRKWVRRHHPDANRRQVQLVLTASGSRLVAAALSARRTELAQLVTDLPAEQRAALGDLLPGLVAAAGTQEPEGSPAWAV